MTRLSVSQLPRGQRPKGRGSDLEEELLGDLSIHRYVGGMEREHRFHPTRRWAFDFAWPGLKVAVEVEGGTWVSGAHGRGAHFASDAEKYNEAAILGWTVLRVTGEMIKDGRAIDFLERLIRSRRLATP